MILNSVHKSNYQYAFALEAQVNARLHAKLALNKLALSRIEESITYSPLLASIKERIAIIRAYSRADILNQALYQEIIKELQIILKMVDIENKLNADQVDILELEEHIKKLENLSTLKTKKIPVDNCMLNLVTKILSPVLEKLKERIEQLKIAKRQWRAQERHEQLNDLLQRTAREMSECLNEFNLIELRDRAKKLADQVLDVLTIANLRRMADEAAREAAELKSHLVVISERRQVLEELLEYDLTAQVDALLGLSQETLTQKELATRSLVERQQYALREWVINTIQNFYREISDNMLRKKVEEQVRANKDYYSRAEADKEKMRRKAIRVFVADQIRRIADGFQDETMLLFVKFHKHQIPASKVTIADADRSEPSDRELIESMTPVVVRPMCLPAPQLRLLGSELLNRTTPRRTSSPRLDCTTS